MLPQIVASSASATATARGALDGVPIAGILGDQQAALVGQTCFPPGEAKNTYGTGCFLLLNTGDDAGRRRPAGCSPRWRIGWASAPACYALEGSIAITGALVQWLRDNLGLIGTAPRSRRWPRSVEDNGGVYFVPAFSGPVCAVLAGAMRAA